MAKKHTVSETNETISAVITALGEGAVGIIRISGTEAAAIGDKLFRSASGKKLTEHTPHLLVYGHVVDEENSKIDEVLAVYMQGPHSYTAEDVVEIQSHGGLQSLKTILGLTYKMGARPAEPGEFTKRAFLNGRIDLIQAEAVMDIIKSRSEASLKMAVRQQDGQLSKKIKAAIPLAIFLVKPDRTLPGPTSTKVSTPPAIIWLTEVSQSTGIAA